MKNFLLAILFIVFSVQGMAVANGTSLMESKTVFSSQEKMETFAETNEISENQVILGIDSPQVLADIEEMSDYISLFAASEVNSEDAISPLATVSRFISINLSKAPPPPRS